MEKQLRVVQASQRPPVFVKANVHPPPEPKPRGPPPGHAGRTRPLPEPDETLMATLPKCPDCKADLGEPLEFVDHTVEDVEPGHRVVRRYRQARYRCAGCGKFQLGLHLTGAAVLSLERRAAREPRPLYKEIRKALRTRKMAQGDETGWKVNGVQHWLWAFSSGAEALFVADRWRGHQVPLWALGKHFPGVLVRDGWAAYNAVECPQQQCLAHINRDLQKREAAKSVKARPLLEPRPPEFTRKGHPPTEFLRFADRLRAILREAVEFHERAKDPACRRRGWNLQETVRGYLGGNGVVGPWGASKL